MDEMKIAATGAFVYGALYLIGVFVAAIVIGDQFAMFAAIAAAGLSYVAQFAAGLHAAGRVTANTVGYAVGVAVAVGVAAGFSLLI